MTINKFFFGKTVFAGGSLLAVRNRLHPLWGNFLLNHHDLPYQIPRLDATCLFLINYMKLKRIFSQKNFLFPHNSVHIPRLFLLRWGTVMQSTSGHLIRRAPAASILLDEDMTLQQVINVAQRRVLRTLGQHCPF